MLMHYYLNYLEISDVLVRPALDSRTARALDGKKFLSLLNISVKHSIRAALPKLNIRISLVYSPCLE